MSYGLLSSSGLPENILTTFGVIFIALFFAFCWKQWLIMRKYRCFPSRRLDVQFILPVILRRYPKDIPFTSLIFQVLLKTAKEFQDEGLCLIWILKPHVLIFNEKHMKNLVNEVDLADKGTSYDINRIFFGNGLLASEHESWKVHRKLLNPAFSVGVLKNKMHVLNKYARQLVDRLETLADKPCDEALKALNYCAFQNMADFVLGLELNNEKHLSMAENFTKSVESGAELFIERISRPWLHWDFTLPLFPSGRKYLKIVYDIDRQVREIMVELTKKKIESRREQPNADSQEASSCGDILMKLYLHDQSFTEKNVRDQLVTFSAAGYHTVYITMLWCLYTLGNHSDVQEKAYNELKSLVPEGDITYEDLAKLKYLECVIKETMRLYSTVPMYERRAIRDIQCGHYTIPKGTDVGVFAFIMHRDANFFPEPEKFLPERFSDSSKLRPWMYIPFFEGYRNCIGKKFAMMEMKVQLAHVLRHFRVTSLNRINDNDLDWTITMKPNKPLKFSFENRLSRS